MRGTPLRWPLAVLLWLLSCAVPCPQARAIGPFRAPRGIVYAIDGAGGFGVCSQTIRESAAADNLPLEVRTFDWSHGYCRVLADQIHAAHMRQQGRKLAALVLRCRQEWPGRPVYLLGHSAGCGVVLNAAENLPPHSVERIILLAPAVSVNYDLRPALASACRGVDVFYSEHDWACLGIGVLLAGTTDRHRTLAAAGKIGFRPVLTRPGDAALYAKLRQYPWDPSLSWTGHKGGHYGAHQPGFLHTFVLPLLDPAAAVARDGVWK